MSFKWASLIRITVNCHEHFLENSNPSLSIGLYSAENKFYERNSIDMIIRLCDDHDDISFLFICKFYINNIIDFIKSKTYILLHYNIHANAFVLYEMCLTVYRQVFTHCEELNWSKRERDNSTGAKLFEIKICDNVFCLI